MIDKRSQIRKVQALVIDKVMSSFFGELYLKFEHGNIVHCRVTENKKPTTIEDVMGLVKEYLETDSLDEEKWELLIRKISGGPHIVAIVRGGLEEIVTLETIDRAEAHRPTGIRKEKIVL